MKNRLLSLALALCLSLGLAAPALALAYGEEYIGYDSTVSQQYRDVPESHWAAQSIATCSQRTWFNGYPDGTFRPEGLITREEAAKVFAVAMGLEIEEDPEVTYTDTADNWARAYIEATKPLFPDATNLQGTASFRPTQTITREETIYALVVAWRYASKATNADLSVLNMFSDTNSISVGVKPYMAVAVSEGLVSGLPDGTIAAQKGLTRAEFATLLARALSHGYGPDSTQAPAITLDRYSSETTQGTMTLSGKVSPMASGTKLTLDGQSVTLDKNGAFSVKVELQKGNNSFTLAAVNAYGVRTSKIVTVKRADPEPSPTPTPAPTRQPEPSQTPEPTPSQTAKPSKEPEPTKDPEPAPSQEPKPSPSQGSDQQGSNQQESSQSKPSQDPKPTPAQKPFHVQIDPDREVLRKGQCGTDLDWVLYVDGELVIAGTGPMDSYKQGNSPWYEVREKIASATLSDGITTVGNYAFYQCSGLLRIDLPDTLQTIGDYAFRYSGLTRIEIPASVTEVCQHAFCDCYSLAKVTIPEGVVTIRQGAFYGCTSLVTVSLPSTVTGISADAFMSCRSLTKITIPASVTTIATNAFYACNRLANVNYGGSEQDWEDVAIASGNDSLTNATIHYNSTGK